MNRSNPSIPPWDERGSMLHSDCVQAACFLRCCGSTFSSLWILLVALQRSSEDVDTLLLDRRKLTLKRHFVRGVFFLSNSRPMDFNVLEYQSHLLQRCHPACGH